MRVSERHPRGGAGSRGVQFRMRETLSVSRVYVMCVTTRSRTPRRARMCTSEQTRCILLCTSWHDISSCHITGPWPRADSTTPERSADSSLSQSLTRLEYQVSLRFVRSTPPPMPQIMLSPRGRNIHPTMRGHLRQQPTILWFCERVTTLMTAGIALSPPNSVMLDPSSSPAVAPQDAPAEPIRRTGSRDGCRWRGRGDGSSGGRLVWRVAMIMAAVSRTTISLSVATQRDRAHATEAPHAATPQQHPTRRRAQSGSMG